MARISAALLFSIAAFVTLLLFAATFADAVSIQWTGYANNGQWDTAGNWHPAQVPGPNDDVTIASGTVQATTLVQISSLTMGTQFGNATNLTVYNTFAVSQGMSVEGNGNLFLASAKSVLSGTVGIDGNLFFKLGTLSGKVNVTKRGAVFMNNEYTKSFTKCHFNVASPIEISGTIKVNYGSSFTATATTTATGAKLVLGGEGSFDFTKGTFIYNITSSSVLGGQLTFGEFLHVGSGDMIMGDVSNRPITVLGKFRQTGKGDIDIQYGPVTFAGAADVSPLPGTPCYSRGCPGIWIHAGGTATFKGKLTGSGTVATAALGGATFNEVDFSGTMHLCQGDATFQGTKPYNVSYFIVCGADLTFDQPLYTATLVLSKGELKTKHVVTAKNVVLYGSITLNARVVVTSAVSGSGNLFFAFGAALTIERGATLHGGSSFTSNPGGRGIINKGLINVTTGNTFSVTNLNVTGGGNVVLTGGLKITDSWFGANTVHLLSKSAVLEGQAAHISFINYVKGSPLVNATVGGYSYTCKQQCTNISTSGQSTPQEFRFAIASV